MDNRYTLMVLSSRTDGKRKEVRELYDQIADPTETTDIALRRPDTVRRMTDQLHAWQRAVERSLSGADYR
jgi:hypothetical protein